MLRLPVSSGLGPHWNWRSRDVGESQCKLFSLQSRDHFWTETTLVLTFSGHQCLRPQTTKGFFCLLLVNDLLLGQILANLFSLNSLLGPSVYFLVRSSFSKELRQGRLSRTLCLHYLIAPRIRLF